MTRTAHRSRPGLWAGLMLGAGALILSLKATGAINPTIAYILAIIPVAFMFVFARTLNRAQTGACGNTASRAALRYTNGMMATSLAYLLGLGIAIWTWRNLEPSLAVTWCLAMLPIAPILAMIYVMGRYIVEEHDEYLRHRAIIAALIGLGFMLAIGSFWGFLETFELVPHVPGWWAVPIWAIGMGLGQAWQSFSQKLDQRDEE